MSDSSPSARSAAAIERARALIDPEVMDEIAGIFGMLGDPTRTRICYALLEAGELCVCDLAWVVGSSQGLVSRETVRQGRGRPHHAYVLTDLGLQQLGDNYGELALLLWNEMIQISDAQIRQAVVGRLRDAFVKRYGAQVTGATLADRLEQLRQALIQRGFHVEIDERGGLPVLRENNCPYHELATADRGICELEQEVFQQVLGVPLTLTQCCRDGHGSCEFQPVTQGGQAQSAESTLI